MGFVEGHVEGEKVFKGKVFPKTFLPPSKGESGACDLVEMVKAERGWLEETLKEHGAILFRGFDVGSAEEYSNVVDAFGWDEFCYEGPADRIKLAERVYTANAVPLHINIPFHHEMAMIREFPPKIFFVCLQAPPEGGQTSIIPSDIIVEKLEEMVPQVVEKLVRDGVKIVLHTRASFKSDDGSDSATGSLLWQRMLKTQDKVEAEKRALKTLACDSVKFNSDGSADFIFGPMNPIKEFGGKRVLFNIIIGYETMERDTYVTFGDGSPIPLDAIDAFNKIMDENYVDVNWQKGDVVLVDNLAVQHARRAGKPPRTVLVSLSN